MTLVLFTIVVLAVLSVVFAVQNSAVITVSFLAWEVDASLALVLMITLIAGVLIGYLSGLPSAWRRGSETRKLRRQVDDLQAVTGAREPVNERGEHGNEDAGRTV
jgi:putative membrane protein